MCCVQVWDAVKSRWTSILIVLSSIQAVSTRVVTEHSSAVSHSKALQCYKYCSGSLPVIKHKHMTS